MKKAVIFDMDGVLVDSQPFHFDVDIQTLKAFGVDITAEIARRYAGMSNLDSFARYINDFDIAATATDMANVHAANLMKQLDVCSLAPAKGVAELLCVLKENGVAMSVASSSSYEFIEKMLDILGIRQYFDFIVSGEGMENGKPAPDIFLFAAKKHGLSVNECAVIEDSAVGVAAAKAAGIFCIGYANPTSGEQDISAADIIIDDFGDIYGKI